MAEVPPITDVQATNDLGQEYWVSPTVNGNGGDEALIHHSQRNSVNSDELEVKTGVLLRYATPPQMVETVLYLDARTRRVTGVRQITNGRRLMFPQNLVLQDLGEQGSALATNINSDFTPGAQGRVRAAIFVPGGR